MDRSGHCTLFVRELEEVRVVQCQRASRMLTETGEVEYCLDCCAAFWYFN